MAFKSLVSAVSEQCQEIRQILSSISYFSVWDADAIAECSRLSSLEEFPPKEVILGSGTGNSHTVYFILDGVCRMIQYLQVETKTTSRGETKYKLYKSGGESVNSESGSDGYASLLFNKQHEFQKEQIMEQDTEKVEEETPEDGRAEGTETKDSHSDVTDVTPQDSVHTEAQIDIENSKSEEVKKDVVYDEDHHIKILEKSRKKLRNIIWVNKKDTSHEIPKNVNGYFIQTGFLFKGACFGLKKYTDKNFIMSETAVKCLKIPQRFLLHHNHCNIWNRILLFDSLYQPKEEKILECFQTDRKWAEVKRKLVEDIISKKEIPNYTGISDVPYSIRLTDVRLYNSGRINYSVYRRFK